MQSAAGAVDRKLGGRENLQGGWCVAGENEAEAIDDLKNQGVSDAFCPYIDGDAVARTGHSGRQRTD